MTGPFARRATIFRRVGSASAANTASSALDTPQRLIDRLNLVNGGTAEIGADGEKWSAYGGKINGRNVELVPGKRIVQTWRAGNWAEGVHSLARFELVADGKGTKLVLDQSGVPEDSRAHIDGGWHKMYWEKLSKHLG